MGPILRGAPDAIAAPEQRLRPELAAVERVEGNSFCAPEARARGIKVLAGDLRADPGFAHRTTRGSHNPAQRGDLDAGAGHAIEADKKLLLFAPEPRDHGFAQRLRAGFELTSAGDFA